MDGNYSLADIAAATGNGRNNDGMFGGDGAWWLIVLFLFVFCGWGNNGWGNNGNGGGYAATAATQADIQRGFDNSAVISKLDGINSGLCDGFYAMNNGMLTGFNGINTNIMQTGFGIQQAINADTVANMQNTNALQAQLANCCCETREAIQGVNYNMAQNTCALQNTMNSNTRDIIDNQNAGTRAVLDYLCAKENADLRDKVQKLGACCFSVCAECLHCGKSGSADGRTDSQNKSYACAILRSPSAISIFWMRMQHRM